MLLNDYFQIKIEKGNKKYYKNKGYECRVGDVIIVHYLDIPKKSNMIIDVRCDYCGSEFRQAFCRYTKATEENIVTKSACKSCVGKKNRESNLIRYGVENISQINQVKQKVKQTNLNKYGVSNYTQTEECKNRIKQTNLLKYGVENAFQNDKVKEKQKQTCLLKYGVENVFMNEEIKQKLTQTMMNKYGVKRIIQLSEYKSLIVSKLMQKRFTFQNAPCSLQQKFLHFLVGGELNFPVNNFYLDIAFPDDMIYIEYNGSGHNLSVRLGHITQIEFNKKEINRYFILKRLGWKQIILKSPKDYLPNDNVILNIIIKCKETFLHNNNIGHIEIDFGYEEIHDTYGELRKIKYLPQEFQTKI